VSEVGGRPGSRSALRTEDGGRRTGSDWEWRVVAAIVNHHRRRNLLKKQLPRLITTFLAAVDHEPMILSEALRPALPNLPLANSHRSNCCGALAIAASSSNHSAGSG
jgi:hypothetical protein